MRRCAEPRLDHVLRLVLSAAVLLTASGWFGRVYLDRSNDYRGCREVDPATADSHWAVVTWVALHYDKSKAAEKRAALDGQRHAEAAIFGRWAGALSGKYPFLVYDGRRGQLEIGDTAKVPPKLLREAIDELKHPIPVKPELSVCCAFPWVKRLSKSKEFAQWLSSGAMPLGGDSATRRGRLIVELERRVDASFTEIRTTTRELLERQRAAVAVRLLTHFMGQFGPGQQAELTGLMIKASKETVQSTLAAIRAGGFGDSASCQLALRKLQQAEAAWSETAFLKHAAGKLQAEVTAMYEAVGTAQSGLWQTELMRLARARRYWLAYEFVTDCSATAKTFPAAARGIAEPPLWERLEMIIPEALHYWQEVANAEIDAGRRHGVALGLYLLAERLAAAPEANGRETPAAVTDALADCRKARQASREFCLAWMKRELFLRDFEPKGGGGTAFVRDLAPVLTEALAESPIVYGVTVDAGLGSARPAQLHDYEVADGILVNWEAGYRPPTEEVVACPRAGASRPVPSTSGTSQPQFVQQIHHLFVRRTTHRADANARVTFTVRHAGDSEPVDVDLTLGRVFVRESLDPRAAKIEERTVSRPVPEDPEPNLTRDELESDVALKKWVREEVIQLLAAKLVGICGAYPLELAARAEAAGKQEKPRLAATYWGLCLAYLEAPNVAPDPTALQQRLRAGDMPSHKAEAVRDEAVLHRRLVELKGGIPEALTQATLAFLRER